jgi:hypothetical protein
VRFEDMVSGRGLACPRCASPSVAAVHPWGRGARAGRGRRRGGRGKAAVGPKEAKCEDSDR